MQLLDSAERIRLVDMTGAALEKYQNAQKLYLQLGDREKSLRLYINIALGFYYDDNKRPIFKEWIDRVEDSLRIYYPENKRYEAYIFFIKAYYYQQQYDSLHYFSELVFKTAPDDPELCGGMYYLRGMNCVTRQKIDSAFYFLKKCEVSLDSTQFWTRTKQQRLGHVDEFYVNMLYPVLSFVYREQGLHTKELECLQRAQQILENRIYMDSSTYSYVNEALGTYHENQGDLDKAVESFERCRQYVLSADAYSRIYNTIYTGRLYNKKGENARALVLFGEARQLLSKYPLQTIRDTNVLCLLERETAVSYTDQTRYDSALYYLQRAEAFAQHPAYLGSVLQAQSTIAFRQQNYRAAIGFSQRALGAYAQIIAGKHRFIAAQHRLLGRAYMELGRLDSALQHAQQSLINSTLQFAQSDWRQNPTLEDGTRTVGFTQSLLLKTNILQRYIQSDSSALVAYFQTAQLAQQSTEARLDELQRESSKADFVSDYYEVYGALVDAATRLYANTRDTAYLVQAFAASERGKSIFLQENLREESAKTFGGIPDSLVQRERLLVSERDFYDNALFALKSKPNPDKQQRLEEQLREVNQRLDALKQRFEREYPAYFQLKYNHQAPNLAAIRAQLDDSTALLEFFEDKQRLYIFGITRRDFLVHQVELDSAFSADCKNLLLELSHPDLDKSARPDAATRYARTAFGVYQKLHLAEFAALAKRWIIVPDGRLNYLPLEALVSVADAPNGYGSLQYLVKNHIFTYQYSANLWLAQRAQAPHASRSGILGFAAEYRPDAAQKGSIWGALNPLPYAQREVEQLQQRYAGRFYFGASANETSFKQTASGYSILHLAMHGLVDNRRPQASSFAFSHLDTASTDDDLLHADEIKRLRLNADLVVLSACESGYGKYQRGEGVVSLGRSFMYAGAPSLLMTLWSINDQSTAFLIGHFYQNLAAAQPKDAALRQSKLAYLQTAEGLAAHPTFWAAFVQVGNNAPIALAKKSGLSGYLWAAVCILAIAAFGWWWKRRSPRA